VVAGSLYIGSAYADEVKTHKVTLTAAYKIGDTECRPGDYKVIVDSSNKVRLTEVKTGKAIDVDAKAESVGTKFDHTAVSSRNVDGVSRLSEIQIGGSKTKIVFQ
jgi:hypothetical protein